MSDTGPRAVDSKSPWVRRALRWLVDTDQTRVIPRLTLIGPVVLYLVLVLCGITTSNIGVDALREDPAAPLGLQLGGTQAVRGDEYGTESPIWLGQMARDGAEAETPLSVSEDLFAQLPHGPASAIVFFEGTALAAGSWIPHEMLFAAKWWLPTLMLFLGLPVWFRYVSGSLRWGYLAAALIYVAPATAWWSGRPVNTLGFVAAGCALALYGMRAFQRRNWIVGTVGMLGAGILLTRLPTYYQPLAIVVGVPLVLATATYILFSAGTWRQRLLSLAAVSVSGLVWTGLLLWENRESIAAGLSTVYPGDRKSSGATLDIGRVFGATALGSLRTTAIDPVSNASELVTAFTVLLVVAIVLLATGRWAPSRAQRAAMIPILALAVFWLSWTTVDWSSFGDLLPLVNRVPPGRAAQGVGYLAILAFCLLMPQWRATTTWAAPLAAAGLAGFIAAYAGSSLQATLMPDLATTLIWASAIVTAAVVLLLVRWPQRLWPMGVAVIAAASLTITAQPILVGLADLRDSDTAQKFMAWGEQSREDGTLWASESQNVDSLMTATGTPSLSARQQVGPDREAWLLLDPSGAHEGQWNRGGLHIQFEWTTGDEVEFVQPVTDVIIVQISPCTLAERFPGFRYAISDTPLEDGCLAERDTFEWSGVQYSVYEVTATP